MGAFSSIAIITTHVVFRRDIPLGSRAFRLASLSTSGISISGIWPEPVVPYADSVDNVLDDREDEANGNCVVLCNFRTIRVVFTESKAEEQWQIR
jgi:hypothetical protein